MNRWILVGAGALCLGIVSAMLLQGEQLSSDFSQAKQEQKNRQGEVMIHASEADPQATPILEELSSSSTAMTSLARRMDPELREPAKPLDPQVMEEKRQQADGIRAELDEMIYQYDENLKDPEARQKIKQQMQGKLETYNDAVLPVALEMMRQQQEAGKN